MLHTRTFAFSLLLAGLLSPAAASEDSPDVVIDSSGRTLTSFPVFASKRQIVIEIRGSDASTRFHYNFHKLDDGSCVAGADDGPVLLPDSRLFKLSTKDLTNSCISYTISNEVVQLSGINKIEEGALVQSPGVFKPGTSALANFLSRLLTIEAHSKKIQDLKGVATKETEAAKRILDELTPQLEALNARLQLLATAQAVTELNTLAPRLADLQTQVAAARDRQTTIKTALDRSVADLEKQISAAKAEKQTLEDGTTTVIGLPEPVARQATPELIALLSQIRQLAGSNRTLMVEDVKKTGLLIYGDYFRPSLYEYVYDDTSKGIRLRRFGSPPLLHPRQRAVLQFVNKLPERHPYTTTASCDVKAGQPPNPNLMRPTFPVPEGTAFARQIGERFLLNRATALTEEQFSCLEELRGNENITLTAGTEGPVLTADSTSKVTTDGTLKTIVTRTNELKPIDLIAGGDKQLPQVRSLYGFNYFTGVVVSALRNPTFYKKLTDLSIVTSSDGKQTITKTYGVTSINGDLQIKPIAGLSFYFKGRDTNRPLRLFEALVPVPTVAFSLSTPADDFFVGGSHEVIRSIQIFYGGHFGRVNKLRDGLVDTTSADGPVTDKKFNHSVFVGLTFNINIVTKIFK